MNYKEIKKLYKQQGLNCKSYIEFLSTINKQGNSKHHILLTSIFGKNNTTINLTFNDHAYAHILLAIDNLEKDYSDNLGKICLAALVLTRHSHYKPNKKTINSLEKYREDITRYANTYAAQKANKSEKAIKARKKNIKKIPMDKKLAGNLHKKIDLVIAFIKSKSSKNLSIESLSHYLAGPGHQRKSEKKTRWKMLFEICGQTLLDNGLDRKVFNSVFKKYDFLDKERFKKWSKIKVNLNATEKRILYKYFSKIKKID